MRNLSALKIQGPKEPAEPMHRCWLEIARSCECCGKSGCSDCLSLKTLPGVDSSDTLDVCLNCFLNEQEREAS